jgi:hypothetical protein
MDNPVQFAAANKASEAAEVPERRRIVLASTNREMATNRSSATRSILEVAELTSPVTRTSRPILGTQDITGIGTAIGATVMVPAMFMNRVREVDSVSVVPVLD